MPVIIIMFLLFLIALLISRTRFLPFHDYNQWVYQTFLLQRLQQGVTVPVDLATAPVPNSIYLYLSWLLGTFLASSESVAKLILFMAITLNAVGLVYMARVIQGRSTILDFIPLVWLLGYYVFVGFISYHISLGIFYFLTGFIHQSTYGGKENTTLVRLILITCMQILLFFAHLFGWLSGVIVTAIYSIYLTRTRSIKDGIRLFSTVIPAFLLLTLYYVYREGVSNIVLYESFTNKMSSFLLPLLVFFRIDPFEVKPLFPAVLNLLLLATVGIMLLTSLEGGLKWKVRLNPLSVPPFLAAILFIVLVLVIPFSWFSGLGRPDERFLLPAFWLGIASFRYLPAVKSRLQIFIILFIAVFVLFTNYWIFSKSDKLLISIHQETKLMLSAGNKNLAISLRDPPIHNACQPDRLFDKAIGIHTLQWFDLYRAIDLDITSAATWGTSILVPNKEMRTNAEIKMLEWDRASIDQIDQLVSQYPDYKFITLMGCEEDIQEAWSILGFDLIVKGKNFVILQNVGGKEQ